MPFETGTRAELTGPAVKARGWTEDHIRRGTTQPRIDLDPASGREARAAPPDVRLQAARLAGAMAI